MAEARKPAKKTAAKRTPESPRENADSGSPIRNAAVKPQQYSEGTGFNAGQLAKSTKYIDGDGNVSDDEPEGGGWVLVAEGQMVSEAQAEQIAGK